MGSEASATASEPTARPGESPGPSPPGLFAVRHTSCAVELQVRTFLLPDNREALGEFLREQGYEPSREPPIEKRDVGDVAFVLVLWFAVRVGDAAAEELDARSPAGYGSTYQRGDAGEPFE